MSSTRCPASVIPAAPPGPGSMLPLRPMCHSSTARRHCRPQICTCYGKSERSWKSLSLPVTFCLLRRFSAPGRVAGGNVGADCNHRSMNAILLLIGLLVGAALGAALGYLLARQRLASLAADLASQTAAAQERARAAADRAALVERAALEKADMVDSQLAERFQALSAEALDRTARTFLEMAEGRLSAARAVAAGDLDSRKAAVEQLVQPLRETLARLEGQLREAEAARRSSHAALTEQVSIARQSSEQLRAQTQALVTALRRPEARGRWGEMQLRRVVELAGMSSKCDFDEQISLSTP